MVDVFHCTEDGLNLFWPGFAAGLALDLACIADGYESAPGGYSAFIIGEKSEDRGRKR